MIALFSLLLPLVSGTTLVRRCLPDATSPTDRAFRAMAVVVLGYGLHAAAVFPWILFGGRTAASLIAVDIALAGGAMVFWRHKPSPAESVGGQGLQRVSSWAAAIAALAVGIHLAVTGYLAPWGGWDAWAIWNLKARFLVHATGQWTLMGDPELSWSHPDYPLLLPSLVARVWLNSGESNAGPVVIGSVFSLAGAAAALGSGKVVPAALSAIVVLVTPLWLQESVHLTADVPLAAFVAFAFGLLLLADRTGARGPALLAGVAAGLGGWTKNEGLLVLLALGASLAMFNRRALPAFLLGAGPLLLIVAVFKLTVAPPSYFVRETTASALLHRLLDPERWFLIARRYPVQFTRLAFGTPLVAIGVLALLGFRMRWPPSWATQALSIVVLGEFAAYLVTPKDLEWQLTYSAHRLALQLWPSMCALFLASAQEPPARGAAAPTSC